MSRQFTEQIHYLIDNPDTLNLNNSDKHELIEKLERIAEKKDPTINDVVTVASAADLDYKSLVNMIFNPFGRMISDIEVRRRIDRDDIKYLIYSASECIVKKDGKIYFMNLNRFSEDKEIQPETIKMMRDFFLKKGYPLYARKLSSCLSHYRPDSLDNMICSEKTFRIYMAGAVYDKAPVVDDLYIDIFNGLCEGDKETCLGWLLETYRNFKNVEKHDETFLTVKDNDSGRYFCVQKDNLDHLITDSPLKTELITLQTIYFETI